VVKKDDWLLLDDTGTLFYVFKILLKIAENTKT
jgi:hypothetical protein